MAKAKAKRKYKSGPKKGKVIPLTQRQKSFGRVAKAANKVCHAETSTVPAYGRCMSREMKAGLGSKKKASAASKCTGIVKSGPRKGRLKKGYTRAGVAKGRCPVKKK